MYAASDVMYLQLAAQLGVVCFLFALSLYLLAAVSPLVVYVDRR